MLRCVYCGGCYAAAYAEGGAGQGLCPRCRAAAAAADRPSAAAALRDAVDAALADTMPAALRAALDQALRDGVTRVSLLALVWHLTGGPGAVPGGLVYLQGHGYLYPEDDNAVL